MNELEITIQAALKRWEDISIRVSGPRVPIDTIIHHVKLGATPEEIGYKYPSLKLVDGYGAIYCYLVHRREVEEYMRGQEAQADQIQQRIEADPQYQHWRAEIRQRLIGPQAQDTPPAAH